MDEKSTPANCGNTSCGKPLGPGRRKGARFCSGSKCRNAYRSKVEKAARVLRKAEFGRDDERCLEQWFKRERRDRHMDFDGRTGGVGSGIPRPRRTSVPLKEFMSEARILVESL